MVFGKDYETIDEPILDEGVLRTHESIQMIISKIRYIKDNMIPDLEGIQGYNLLVGNNNDNVVKEICSKKKELEKLQQQKEKL